MSEITLRREIKKAVDQLPKNLLGSVADYIAFLSRPKLKDRIAAAEREFKAGKGVNWREVRDDV